MKFLLKPCSLKDANAFVMQHHRHHSAVQGHKFSLCAVSEAGAVVGVAIVGRPIARYLDAGCTLEITRLCTDGSKNCCSFLYGAAARAARALGYSKIITYILQTENGSSLKAAGFKCENEAAGGGVWHKQAKGLLGIIVSYPTCRKRLFVKLLI